MDSLLLIGSGGAELKRLKAHLLKQGFHASVLEPRELDRLEESDERFILGIVDGTADPGLRECLAKVRAVRAGKELPLVALIQEGNLRELHSVKGLEDFLLLPSTPELIEARVRFVLARLNHLPPGGAKRIGALEINVDRYEVLLEGEPLELTYKEFELFKFLATHPGRVFSRDQLLNQVWSYNFIGGTRTVDVHIRRLRAKLGPKYASLIATLRNVGYKFLDSL